jgi:hypothetical protein
MFREPAEAEKALGLIKNILAMQNGVNKGSNHDQNMANKFY